MSRSYYTFFPYSFGAPFGETWSQREQRMDLEGATYDALRRESGHVIEPDSLTSPSPGGHVNDGNLTLTLNADASSARRL